MRALPLLLAASLAGCAAGSAPAGTVTIRGRLVDAETGERVARTTIFVHAIDDANGGVVTAKPDAADSFELAGLPPTVRLRVADTSDRYRLNEQQVTVPGESLDTTISLVPTHWVRLHGRVLWRDGERLRPPSEGDGDVVHGFLCIGPKYGIRPEKDGSYSVRVPREVVEIAKVNTSRSPSPHTVDLREVAGDEKELDIILE